MLVWETDVGLARAREEMVAPAICEVFRLFTKVLASPPPTFKPVARGVPGAKLDLANQGCTMDNPGFRGGPFCSVG